MNKKKLFVIALSNEINFEALGVDLKGIQAQFNNKANNLIFNGDVNKRLCEEYSFGSFTIKNNAIEVDNNAFLITGIGKVNATYYLSTYLSIHKNDIDVVYNVGTAGGGAKVAIGEIISINRFTQWDIDATPQDKSELGFTPYDDTPRIIEFPNKQILNDYNMSNIYKMFNINTDNDFICASADKFNVDNTNYEVYDMEAYGFAKTCWRNNINYTSIKYITDKINLNKIYKNDERWKIEIPKAREVLTNIVLEIMKI